jgi:hypothetical protein
MPTAKPSRRPAAKRASPGTKAGRATLTISSRNYSSWSLRGWLMARFARLDFDAVMVPPEGRRCPQGDPAAVAVDPRAAPHA